jgi:hypothetical protein
VMIAWHIEVPNSATCIIVSDILMCSKSSYERKLRAWGFRKKVTKAHKEFLKLRLEIRQRQNIESDVYIDGMLIPKNEIRQKINRMNLGFGERMTCKYSCAATKVLSSLIGSSGQM